MIVFRIIETLVNTSIRLLHRSINKACDKVEATEQAIERLQQDNHERERQIAAATIYKNKLENLSK